VAVIDYHAKTGRRMEAYNIADGSSVILDKALSEDDDFKVEKFSWLSNDVVAVLYNNNKFDCFDVKTGKCIKSFEVKEDISDINEIIPLNSENIALVSDNYFISKFNTTTGTISDKLDLKELSEESITKFTSGDYDITADGKDIIFSSSGHAWVIDIDLFKVRYNIENYTAYDPKNNRVIVGEYNKAGYYPLYTTEELIKKAKSYIA
jgi:hypothetical protein